MTTQATSTKALSIAYISRAASETNDVIALPLAETTPIATLTPYITYATAIVTATPIVVIETVTRSVSDPIPGSTLPLS